MTNKATTNDDDLKIALNARNVMSQFLGKDISIDALAHVRKEELMLTALMQQDGEGENHIEKTFDKLYDSLPNGANFGHLIMANMMLMRILLEMFQQQSKDRDNSSMDAMRIALFRLIMVPDNGDKKMAEPCDDPDCPGCRAREAAMKAAKPN